MGETAHAPRQDSQLSKKIANNRVMRVTCSRLTAEGIHETINILPLDRTLWLGSQVLFKTHGFEGRLGHRPIVRHTQKSK